MATPLDPNAIVQVTINGELYDQQCLNVLHYFFEDGTPNFRDTFDDLATEIDMAGGILNKLCAAVTTDWSLVSLDIQEVYPNRLAKVSYLATLANKVGVLIGPALPSNVAAVLTKRCDFAGRGFIGSVHVAGIPITEQNGDLWSAPEMGVLSNLGGQLQINLAAGFVGPFVPCLWNIATPINHPTVVSVIPQDTVRVMRRRTKGVGR